MALARLPPHDIFIFTPASTSNQRRSFWHTIWLIVVVALVTRLLVAATAFGDMANPAESHSNFGEEIGWTARSLTLGLGFSSPFAPATGPTALVPPLYTFLVAGIFKVFGLYSRSAAFVTLALNSFFSALTCIPLYLSTRKNLGSRAARWAAWVWAIYPFSIYFSACTVGEYALTSLLFATCFWLAQELDGRTSRWTWAGFGALCGTTMLSNPAVAPVLLGLFALAALKARWRREPWIDRAAVTCLVICIMLVPWTVRNYRTLHIVTPMRDGLWLECWAGNAGDSSQSNPAWAHPASSPAEMERYRALGEVAYMQSKHMLAVAFIAHHPAWFAEVTARRFIRYWTGFWSLSRSYRTAQPLDLPNMLFCIPLTWMMILGIVRWARSGIGRWALRPYLLTIILFPLPYYLTHTSMDYRQPIESVVVVLIVAAFALSPSRKVLDDLSSGFDEETSLQPVRQLSEVSWQ